MKPRRLIAVLALLAILAVTLFAAPPDSWMLYAILVGMAAALIYAVVVRRKRKSVLETVARRHSLHALDSKARDPLETWFEGKVETPLQKGEVQWVYEGETRVGKLWIAEIAVPHGKTNTAATALLAEWSGGHTLPLAVVHRRGRWLALALFKAKAAGLESTRTTSPTGTTFDVWSLHGQTLESGLLHSLMERLERLPRARFANPHAVLIIDGRRALLAVENFPSAELYEQLLSQLEGMVRELSRSA